jgi:hypothetical protein
MEELMMQRMGAEEKEMEVLVAEEKNGRRQWIVLEQESVVRKARKQRMQVKRQWSKKRSAWKDREGSEREFKRSRRGRRRMRRSGRRRSGMES